MKKSVALLFSTGNAFAALTEKERANLLEVAETKVFSKGQHIFKSGKPVRGVFCILSGVVRISQPQGSREVVVRLASTGEWIGHRSIFTSEVYRGSAQAKDKVIAAFIPTETVTQLFGSNREFANQLIRLIARDLERAERLLFEHQRLNVSSRLISLFRTLDQKIGQESTGGRQLATKLTKVEIAQMIGASQEVVSRQLSKWKRENLLREENRRIFLSKDLLQRIIR